MSVPERPLDTPRRIAAAYALILAAVSALNYVPGLTDAEGRAFGIFALDIYDDALHLASALWAAWAAWRSRAAALTFLKVFGALYLADGLMGLATGSGYLDLGIVLYGAQSMPLPIRVFGNLPHVGLGGLALVAGWLLGRNGSR